MFLVFWIEVPEIRTFSSLTQFSVVTVVMTLIICIIPYFRHNFRQKILTCHRNDHKNSIDTLKEKN